MYFLLYFVSGQLCFLLPYVQLSQYCAWWLYGPSYSRQMCLFISLSLLKLFWLRPSGCFFKDVCMSCKTFEFVFLCDYEPKLLKLRRISASVWISLFFLAEAALSIESKPLLGDVEILKGLSCYTAKLGVCGLITALFRASYPSISNWSQRDGDPSWALFLPLSIVLRTNGPFFA